jgi:hypothetical protein
MTPKPEVPAMADILYSIAYFSRNAQPAGVALEAEIADILASARRNNVRTGVTGALLFSAGCFAQVLEGPLAAVESIFETIQCDPRHVSITVLHFRPIPERNFGQWSMAYAGTIPAESGIVVDGIFEAPHGIARSTAGEELVQVLQGLVQRNDANNRYDAKAVDRRINQ